MGVTLVQTQTSCFVVAASVFCQSVLLRVCDSYLVPELHDIQAWVDPNEQDFVPYTLETAVLEAELEWSRDRFTNPVEFISCNGNWFYFWLSCW